MSLSKYSLPSIENIRYQLHSLELHQKRLQEINQKSTRISSKNSLKAKPRKQFDVLNLNPKELEQQNLNLLKKLIEIAQTREKSPLRSITPFPRTLNTINRKKEIQRITKENKRIADRIASQSPVLSSKIFAKDYSVQIKYRDILRKHSLFNRKRVFSIKQFENVDRSFKSQKKQSSESSKKLEEISIS